MDRKIETLVVGADHYNTLWLVRSLGMAHLHPGCIIINKRPTSFVGASKYCEKCYIANSYKDALSIMQSIEAEHRLPVIASGDEAAAFLDRNYDTLSSKYILHNCSNKGGQIFHWMDKGIMLRHASASGFTIPFTRTLKLDEKRLCLDDIPFPCLIKPEISALASKKNFRICYTLDDLQRAISEVKSQCTQVVLQELIIPEYEYLVYGVRTMQNEIIIPGGNKKVHTCSDISNMGMTSVAYSSSNIPSQLGDFSTIKRFLCDINYHGIFSIEFMITEDKAYFLEINFRNDGTVYCTTQSGVNIPALWATSAMGQKDSSLSLTYKRKRTYCMNETNYIKYTLRHQPIGKSIFEIFKTKAFSLIKWDDMKPVFAKAFPSLFAFKKITPP